MILPPLRYLRPSSLEEAVHWLSGLDDAVVLAGGQTLINALKLDLVAPSSLIDVHRLDELHGVEVAEDGTVTIGAATTYAAIAASPAVRVAAPSIASMAAGLVDRQVRNRGTIGGNVCLNDPTNNFPALLVALGARLNTVGPHGPRTVGADDFFVGTMVTDLRDGELLVSVEVPPLPVSSHVLHRHLQVGADSWAMARCVVRLDAPDGTVTAARVVLGAVLGSPHRLLHVEESLVGRPLDAELELVATAAFDSESVTAADDVHCSADYRREMAKVQLRRALRDIVNGGRG
jgi:carbon-monoxide dehydrogenase medium subunit